MKKSKIRAFAMALLCFGACAAVNAAGASEKQTAAISGAQKERYLTLPFGMKNSRAVLRIILKKQVLFQKE